MVQTGTMPRIQTRHLLIGLVAGLLAGSIAAAGESPAGGPAAQPNVLSMPKLKDFYTRDLKKAGAKGTARIKICIDDAGQITATEVLSTSGSAPLDEAARQYAAAIRFEAAIVGGVRQGGCFGLPVTFPPGALPTLSRAAAAASAEAAANRPQIVSAPDLSSFYPSDSRERREAGIVRVRACFGADGRVNDATIDQSSGSRNLDAAALKAAKQYRFKPVVKEGAPQPDCLIMPINFLPPQGAPQQMERDPWASGSPGAR